MELRVNTEYGTASGVYLIKQTVHHGFDLFAIYLSGRIVATFHSERAAVNKLYALIYHKPREYDEPRVINYKTID